MKMFRRALTFLLACSLFCLPVLADDAGTGQPKIVTEYYSEDILSQWEDSEAVAAAAPADFSALNAKSFLLMEQDTGRVLAENNADEILAPASITKIMSLLLFMEALDQGKLKPDQEVSCSEHAASMGGSQIWLEPGETMTVNDLLKAVAIGSANDATTLLAEAVAGSEEGFVSLMNQRATDLGMTNTHFVNCSGLDEAEHHTTARDIARMSRELMTHDRIQEYTTVWMDTLRNGATQLVNTNKLVRFYNGATGLKTGTTDQAGCCLSATATRDGLSLIAVVMGCPTSNDRFSAAKALLNYGFANYCHLSVPIPLDEKAVLPVTGGTQLSVPLKKPKAVSLLAEKGNTKATVELHLPESLTAPVMAGEVVGQADIKIGDDVVAKVEIKAAQDVGKMTWSNGLLRMLTGIFHV